MKHITTFVHISEIKAGDIIIHNGQDMTVCGKDIKKDRFMGTSIFGDSYRCGNKLVEKVVKYIQD